MFQRNNKHDTYVPMQQRVREFRRYRVEKQGRCNEVYNEGGHQIRIAMEDKLRTSRLTKQDCHQKEHSSTTIQNQLGWVTRQSSFSTALFIMDPVRLKGRHENIRTSHIA